jgi:PAS domain S-box-containing protein
MMHSEGRPDPPAPWSVEAAVRESEERFRMLANTAPVMVWITDASGERTFVSQSWLDYTGHDLQQELSTDWTERVHPDDRAACLVAYQAAFVARERFTVEYRLRRHDGVYCWLLDTGVPRFGPADTFAGFIGSCVDITDRKQTEEALRASEERFRLMVEGSEQIFFFVHDTEHHWEYLSPSVEAVLGYAPDELLGRRFDELLTGDRSDMVVTTRTEAAVTSGERVEPYVALLRHKAGHALYIEVVETPLIVAGRIAGVQGFARDITERKRSEEELERHVAERTRELSTLLDVSRTVGSTLELKPLIGLILEQLKQVVDNDGSAIFILRDEDELALLHYQGPLPLEQLALRWSLQEIPHVRQVIRGGHPLIIADVLGDTVAARSWRATSVNHLGELPMHIATWMGVPLLFHDRVIGMLSADFGRPNYYTEHHAELMLAFASQAAVAIENARLYEQAHGLAVLMERQRLARELHDSVSQALYGIALGARTARTLLDRDPSRLAEPLDYVLSLAEAALAEMRALIFELRPESLANEGLTVALEKQAASLRTRHQVEVETHLCPEPDLPFEVKEALFRIAQEALNNTAKHARASKVVVSLTCDQAGVGLDIRDDGIGFDPSGSFPGHLGQQTMRERAAKLDGTLRVTSTPGQGTTVSVHLPRPCEPRDEQPMALA